jgi:hypothetical protein
VNLSAQKNTKAPISRLVAILALYSRGTTQLVIAKVNKVAIEKRIVENIFTSCLYDNSTDFVLREKV